MFDHFKKYFKLYAYPLCIYIFVRYRITWVHIMTIAHILVISSPFDNFLAFSIQKATKEIVHR